MTGPRWWSALGCRSRWQRTLPTCEWVCAQEWGGRSAAMGQLPSQLCFALCRPHTFMAGGPRAARHPCRLPLLAPLSPCPSHSTTTATPRTPTPIHTLPQVPVLRYRRHAPAAPAVRDEASCAWGAGPGGVAGAEQGQVCAAVWLSRPVPPLPAGATAPCTSFAGRFSNELRC